MASGAAGILAGRAYVELGLSDKLSAGLKRAQSQLDAFGSQLRAVGVGLMGAGSAITGPLMGAAKLFADVGDQLYDMSIRTGMSTEALSELGYAAEMSGANLEVLEAGVARIQRAVVAAAGGSEQAADALARFGLSAADLIGLSPEQQFNAIADGLAGIKNPAERAAASLALLGRDGRRLIPLMEGGAAGMAAMRQQARALGLTVSRDAAVAATNLDTAMGTMWRTLKQVTFTIGSALAPEFTALSNKIASVAAAVTKWVNEHKQVIATAFKVAAAVAAVGAGIVGLSLAISGISNALGAIRLILGAAKTGFNLLAASVSAILSPVGLVVTALIGLGAVIAYYTDFGSKAIGWLGDTFQWLKTIADQTIKGIIDALSAGDLELAAKVGWAGMKVAWLEGTEELRLRWEEFRHTIERVAIEGWYAVRREWVNFCDWWWKNYPDFTKKVATAWAWMCRNLETNFSALKYGIQWAWHGLMGLFDETYDVAGAREVALMELTAEVVAAQRAYETKLDEIARKAALSPAELEAERIAAIKQINEAEEKAKKAGAAAHAERLGKAKEEAATARAELDKLTAAAAAAAPAAPGAPAKPAGPGAIRLGVLGAGAALQERASVIGTFSAELAGRLGGGPLGEVAKNTRATVQRLESIERVLRTNGNGEGGFFEE